MKGLINIKNNGNKCFHWCHIRHLNLVKMHPERITKEHKNMINDLDYEGIKCPVLKKDYCRIDRQNNICINVFCYENGLTYPVYVSDQKFHNSMDLLLISNGNKSHYVYTKDFTRFMCNNTKTKNKNYFCKCCLQCFISDKVLIEDKENCLIINDKESVKLKSGSISFKIILNNYLFILKSMLILKGVKSSDKNNSSYTEKYQDHISCSFPYKVFCIDNKLLIMIIKNAHKMIMKNAAYRLIESILKEYDYCKKMIKKHSNKNLIMSAEKDERFQLSNSCWICDKLFDVGDDKVRDHCHIARKYRDAAHWSCNNDLEMTKKITAIFHNLRGYDSHLIIKEISKFDGKVTVILNGLEKYMAFTINTVWFLLTAYSLWILA